MVIGKPLFTVKQIGDKVAELGEQISVDYEGKHLHVIPLLKGAFMFASDLVRSIRVPMTLDFIHTKSYVGTESSGEVKVRCDLRDSIKDRDVLLVEDIADTGTTLNFVRKRLIPMGPRSLKICVFLNKEERRVEPVTLDYIGFDIPDQYVVGYGLDYEDKYRNLPYIAIFKKTA